MIRRAGFRRKARPRSEIPAASLADMAFLLLIFFMVSTRFPQERPRPLPLPEAAAAQELRPPRRAILHVFVERDGAVYIHDRRVPPDRISDVIAPLREASGGRLVVSVRAHRDVPYRFIDAVQRELREAGALRIAFQTRLEPQAPGGR